MCGRSISQLLAKNFIGLAKLSPQLQSRDAAKNTGNKILSAELFMVNFIFRSILPEIGFLNCVQTSRSLLLLQENTPVLGHSFLTHTFIL